MNEATIPATNDGTQDLVVPEVRALYPHILTPHGFQDQTPKFSTTLLIPKDSPFAGTLLEAVQAIQKTNGLKEALPKDKLCVVDGDYNEKPGSEGCWMLRVSNKNRPQALNRDKSPILAEDQSPFYSGCYVDAVVSLWFMNNKFGRRVNGNLKAIRFLRDGEALSGGGRDHTDALPDLQPDAAPAAAAPPEDDAPSNPFEDLNA